MKNSISILTITVILFFAASCKKDDSIALVIITGGIL